MKVAASEHLSRPWRIHEVAPEFRVEDVWRFPGTGDATAFELLVDRLTSYNPLESRSFAVRNLFAVRQRLGDVLGWDELSGEPALRLADRVPEDIRGSGAELSPLPFRQLYRTEEEWAAESANATMHGVLHLGRIDLGADQFGAQLAVLVKPNGLFGEAYMAFIKPFRYLVVYPRLLSGDELGWPNHSVEAPPGSDAPRT